MENNTGNKLPVCVIGHKNPDTDSVCSAICYAALKKKLTGMDYVPKIAGSINSETEFVLRKAGVKKPELITDVRTQVSDIEIRKVAGVDGSISLKNAWEIMQREKLVTLPVTNQEKLAGLITIGDIARTYMEVYENDILSQAETKYSNIVDTLRGTIVVGDEHGLFEHGKVIIGAANPDLMESYIQPGDLVILGNRYESQLCAIEMSAACVVVTDGAKVSLTIQKMAASHNCMIISTPYDTYTVARLINQSMSVSYFMKNEDLISFHLEDYIDNIQGIMASKRYRYFPILDENDKLAGLISRRNVLSANKKKLILVDHNEKNQAVDGVDEAEILEIIDHHRIGNIETVKPIVFRNQPLGCTATIIYQMYKEKNIPIGKKIAILLCSAILSDTLMFRSPTCTEYDKAVAGELAELVDMNIEEYACEMFQAGSNISKKSEKEIFYQDFKRFNIEKTTIGIGQINSMSSEELDTIQERITPYMKTVLTDEKFDMLFFMLTNIPEKSTRLLFMGDRSEMIIDKAFGPHQRQEDSVDLAGVVSRKKQILPDLMEAILQK